MIIPRMRPSNYWCDVANKTLNVECKVYVLNTEHILGDEQHFGEDRLRDVTKRKRQTRQEVGEWG